MEVESVGDIANGTEVITTATAARFTRVCSDF